MDKRSAIDGRAGGMMLVLCAIWGLQQVAVKAASLDIAPVLQIAFRSGLAAVMVGMLMLARGERMSLRDGTWRAGMLVGVLFALEFLLVGEGLRHTSASHMVMFLYTAPIFAALGLHWKLPAERLQPAQWLGIAIAFAGIVTAFTGRTAAASASGASNSLLGDLLGVAGGIAWGATTVVVRCSRLAHASVTQTLLYQLVGAFVLLMLAALLLGQTHFTMTPVAWSSLIFQVILVSFASFLAWFWLLRHYLASRLGVLSFMTPLFGISFGVWLLGEPLEPNFIAGALLVLVGILLVSGYEWFGQLLVRYKQRSVRR
jgi:drug/metabolite transporter (DMT)-like permease